VALLCLQDTNQARELAFYCLQPGSPAPTLAGLSAAARGGSLDDTAALAAARSAAAELERSELALIKASSWGNAAIASRSCRIGGGRLSEGSAWTFG
jgi:hypothetical protein